MMQKNWLKVTVASDPLLSEPLSDFIMGFHGAGVEMSAADEPGAGTLSCYFENPNLEKGEIKKIIDTIKNHLGELEKIFNLSGSTISWELIAEDDWGKNWKKHFTPFEIVPGLVICPTWEDYTAEDGQSVITMDPGMAFGTGHHPTTSLCIEFIRETLGGHVGNGGQTIVDVGTGTAILAMAGILFGAETAMCLDNDPEAVRVARENIQLNKMQQKITVSPEPLSALAQQYHLVIANIVHDVLLEMSEDLLRVLRKDGSLILSGLLAGEQLDNILAVFSAKSLTLCGVRQHQGWAAVRFSAN